MKVAPASRPVFDVERDGGPRSSRARCAFAARVSMGSVAYVATLLTAIAPAHMCRAEEFSLPSINISYFLGKANALTVCRCNASLMLFCCFLLQLCVVILLKELINTAC